MAAPKKKPTTATKGYTSKVNASTGFTTGVQTVKKANKASAKVKPYAPRGTSTTTRARGRDPLSTGKLGEAVSAIGSALGRHRESFGSGVRTIARAPRKSVNVPTIVEREKRKIAAVKKGAK
jgi:hypothetical protein